MASGPDGIQQRTLYALYESRNIIAAFLRKIFETYLMTEERLYFS